MGNEGKTMNVCSRFRGAFTGSFGKPIRWCTGKEAIWVEEPGMLHSLRLMHYGQRISPPIWRAQVNYVNPHPVVKGWSSVLIGDARYALIRGCFMNVPGNLPVVSHHMARKQVCSEISFHREETEAMGEWLGGMLGCKQIRKAPPIPIDLPDDEVVKRTLSPSGYLWTRMAWDTYEAARKQHEARWSKSRAGSQRLPTSE